MMLERGGILFIDDVQVYACAQLMLLLTHQPEYELVSHVGKMAPSEAVGSAVLAGLHAVAVHHDEHDRRDRRRLGGSARRTERGAHAASATSAPVSTMISTAVGMDLDRICVRRSATHDAPAAMSAAAVAAPTRRVERCRSAC
jgi:hypothetical protein